MDDYLYIYLKINKETGEVIDMSRNIELDKNIRDEIIEVYRKLNITSNKKTSSYSPYSEFSHYNYNERSSLDNSTYARI